jgi:hypothetical protein
MSELKSPIPEERADPRPTLKKTRVGHPSDAEKDLKGPQRLKTRP